MCGLVGYITKSNFNKLQKNNILSSLLYADSLRGFDSTGVAFINKDTSLIYKRAMPGHDFICTKAYNTALNKMDVSVAIGHNRLATHGTIDDENAHPFVNRHITLTHNGVVNGAYNRKEFDVDSKWLCHLLAEGSPKDLHTADGSYALVWYDNLLKRVRFYRNNSRAFYYVVDATSEAIYYASESKMLEWVVSRELNREVIPIEVKPEVLYTINPEDLSIVEEELPIEKKSYPTTTYSKIHTNGNSSKWDTLIDNQSCLKALGLAANATLEVEIDDIDNKMGQCSFIILNKKDVNYKDVSIKYFYKSLEEEYKLLAMVGKKVTVQIEKAKGVVGRDKYFLYVSKVIKAEEMEEEKKEVSKSKEIIPIEGALESNEIHVNDLKVLPGPNKSLISINEFTKLTKFGCAMCQGNITEQDIYSMSWFNKDSPICPPCTHLVTKETYSGETYGC